MKMLISSTPLSRQTPHSANFIHTVSLSNGRWFNNSNTNGFIGSGKANGNGYKIIPEDVVTNYRSSSCVVATAPSPVLLTSCGVKETSVSPKSPPVESESSNGILNACQPKYERKIISEAVRLKQDALVNRAQMSLKRLKLLRSNNTRRVLFGEVKSAAFPSHCGDTQRTDDSIVSGTLPETSQMDCRKTQEALEQLIFDAKRLIPDLQDEEATDMEEEDDDAYFKHKEAQSLTENCSTSPVVLPRSLSCNLEKTPAWRYETERLSLAAREAYLRIKIAELDLRLREISERAPSKLSSTSSSQSDNSFITHSCSSARTRPYFSSASRKRTYYRIASDRVRSDSGKLGSRVIQSSGTTAPAAASCDSTCHCSCRSLGQLAVQFPSCSQFSPPVSCFLCQSRICQQNVVASQPDIDPETRLALIDPAFHPKLSKLNGCNVLTSTKCFDRLDTAAACLLDHAYSAEPILAKPKPLLPARKPSDSGQQAKAATSPAPKELQPSTSFSLPPIPLPAQLQRLNKLPNAFFVDPATLETASRLRVRKSSFVLSSESSDQDGRFQKQGGKLDGKKKKLLMQRKRRLEQRKRLQLQRLKEQQRRKQQQKAKRLALSTSSVRRSSVQGSVNGKCLLSPSSSLSSSVANSFAAGSLLSISAPCTTGSLPSTPSVAVGSGGFDIDNVVIPPPTPAALLAAVQVLAESAVEIATPGFRRVHVEPLRPIHRPKQPRLSTPLQSTKDSTMSVNGPLSLSEQSNNSNSGSLDESSGRLNFSSSSEVFGPSTPTVLSETPILVRPPTYTALVQCEDTDDVAYRQRHAPLEQQERARYLAIMQHTIAPRKIRDLAVNARPPNANGKSKGLSKSCTEERLRRSSRVSAHSCPATLDPECKPFVFPLSEAEWKSICAEKEAFSQLKHE